MQADNDTPFMELPRVFAGTAVPHFEQYTGPIAAHLPRLKQFLGFCASIPPNAHAAETMAARPEPTADEVRGYSLHDGIAVMELSGPMTKYGSSFAPHGGTVRLKHSIRNARSNSAVKGAVLRIDSPGGMVAGTDELADEVKAFAADKPIIVAVEDLCASGAYWVASQATAIVANRGADVGSIGVYAVIDDWSGFYAREGVKTHVIRAGKFKGAGVEGAEITADQLTEWQREIDAKAELFIDAIVSGRGMSKEQAAALADGKIWVAAEAKSLGLIDKVGRMEVAMRLALSSAKERTDGMKSAAGTTTAESPTIAAAIESQNPGESKMGTETGSPPVKTAATLQELKAAFPDATADFRENCQEQGFTMEQATQARLAAMREELKASNAALETAKAQASKPGNPVVPSGGSPKSGGGSGSAREEWNDAIAEQKAKGKTFEEAARAVEKAQPELRQRMLDEHNAMHAEARGKAA